MFCRRRCPQHLSKSEVYVFFCCSWLTMKDGQFAIPHQNKLQQHWDLIDKYLSTSRKFDFQLSSIYGGNLKL